MGSFSGRCMASGLPIDEQEPCVEVYALKDGWLHKTREDDLESGPTMFSMLSSIGNCDAVFAMKGLYLEEWASKRTGSTVDLKRPDALTASSGDKLAEASSVLWRQGLYFDYGIMDLPEIANVWKGGLVHMDVWDWLTSPEQDDTKDGWTEWALGRNDLKELTHEEFLASKPHVAEYINKQNSLIRFFRNGIRLGLYFNLSQFPRTTGSQWEEPDEREFRRRYLKLLGSLSEGEKNYAF